MTHVVVTAVFSPKPGATQALAEALRTGIPAIHAEPGCILYAIHDAADGTIVMIEKWSSREDLAAHAAGPAVVELSSLIAPHLAMAVVVPTMTAIPAGTEQQGVL